MKKLLFALALASGCASSTVANQCPGSSNLGCLTRPVCSEDKARGCMKCTCDGPDNVPPPPPGTSPDG